MASRYFGINRGTTADGAVTEGAATTSKSLEVVVDLAVFGTQQEVILGLQKIIAYLIQEGSITGTKYPAN